LNRDDVQGESDVFPHAFSNSEWGYAAKYAAKNVIDGEKPSGTEDIPCWSPNIRADAFLQIDFGHDVALDTLAVCLAADGEHTAFFESALCTFSDGTAEKLTFRPSAEEQRFSFEKRTTRFVRLSDFTRPAAPDCCGIAEVECFGVSAPEGE
ncbi:MAG: hypothetical protein IKE64_14295, partial [Thermoguttaceae bacterium]|nr:hypothetical protein [Thermoguttaceae bacterium]